MAIQVPGSILVVLLTVMALRIIRHGLLRTPVQVCHKTIMCYLVVAARIRLPVINIATI